MAYERPHLKISFGGTLATGQEEWACSIHVGSVAYDMQPENAFRVATDRITDVAGSIETFFKSTAANVPDDVKLRWVKMALIGTDGKYMGPAVEIPMNAAGISPSAYIPQSALVYTLDSGKWKDPGKYNRFYLPRAIGISSANWRLSTDAANAAANGVKTLIEAINDDLTFGGPGSDQYVSVVSNAGSGYDNPVLAVRVGRIIDTQRRRRNQLPEDYSTAEVVV